MSNFKTVEEVEDWVKRQYSVTNGRGEFPADFSTSYVRNVLSRVNLIHNESKINTEQAKYILNELKIYLVYESGRKNGVKKYNQFVLDEIAKIDIGNPESVRDFSQAIEASVAFLKFYGLAEKVANPGGGGNGDRRNNNGNFNRNQYNQNNRR